MQRVVIESPFAGDVAANLAYVRRCMHDCLVNHNQAPYASHALYTQDGVLDDQKPEERTLGMEAGFIWGQVADRVAVYVDRGISNGMREGIKRAKAAGKPIDYRSLDYARTTRACELLSCKVIERVEVPFPHTDPERKIVEYYLGMAAVPEANLPEIRYTPAFASRGELEFHLWDTRLIEDSDRIRELANKLTPADTVIQ